MKYRRANGRQACENLERLAAEGVFEEPDIDQELLDEARRHLGVKPRNVAIDEALRRFVECQRAQRRRALKELTELSAHGAFNCDSLDEDPG